MNEMYQVRPVDGRHTPNEGQRASEITGTIVGPMPYGENEERENEESAPSLHSPYKEEREKEEICSALRKKSKKNSFLRPSAEDFLAIHEELGIDECKYRKHSTMTRRWM